MWKTGLPVRSAVLKPHAGRLVVGWVTTSEYLLLYVLHFWLTLSDLWPRTFTDQFSAQLQRKVFVSDWTVCFYRSYDLLTTTRLHKSHGQKVGKAQQKSSHLLCKDYVRLGSCRLRPGHNICARLFGAANALQGHRRSPEVRQHFYTATG